MEKISLIDTRAEHYAEMFCDHADPVANKIAQMTADVLQYDDMLSGYQVTGLLKLLIKITAAKTIAEIGMFTGFASCQMAKALPHDGRLYCLESNQRYIDLAVSQMKHFDWFEKIIIWHGNARLTVVELPENLDLVFLDADKEFYPDYYEVLIPKLRPGGILVIDNVFWRGNIFAVEPDRKAAAIMELSSKINKDNRVDAVMLTIRDGITIVTKKH
jgi:caffeoyl-CoA O-methyltransferase